MTQATPFDPNFDPDSDTDPDTDFFRERFLPF
jgi:hypothetical protein